MAFGLVGAVWEDVGRYYLVCFSGRLTWFSFACFQYCDYQNTDSQSEADEKKDGKFCHDLGAIEYDQNLMRIEVFWPSEQAAEWSGDNTVLRA